MNVYPIFQLEKVFLTDKYEYVLVSRKAIYYGWAAPSEYAKKGDILFVKNESCFWICTEKKGEFWEKRPFEDLPQEYKAWVLLVGF